MRSPSTLILAALVLPGCATMHTARALHPGEHAVGLTLGGPTLTSPLPIPMPNLTVEGQVGLPLLANRPNALRFGTNLTGYAFGQIAVHAGWTWQLAEPNGAIPAFAVTNQLFLDTNVADWTRPPGARALWAIYHLEATISWDAGPHLIYTGLAEYLDLGRPDLMLTPFVGTGLRVGTATLQLESRWWAMNQRVTYHDVKWLKPGGLGALGFSLGVQVPIGRRQP